MTKVIHKSPYGGEYKLSLSFFKYHNGQTAIKLYDMEDGMPYATATVCVEDALLKEDEVAIKNYSENAGILEALIDGEIVDHPHAFIQSDYVKIPVCKLLLKTE
jgi:hypothetical protein